MQTGKLLPKDQKDKHRVLANMASLRHHPNTNARDQWQQHTLYASISKAPYLPKTPNWPWGKKGKHPLEALDGNKGTTPANKKTRGYY